MAPQWSCALEPQPQCGSAPRACNAVLLESPHTCLCLGRFLCQELPASPFTRIADLHSGVLQASCTSCLTFGPSPAAHLSPTRCRRKPRLVGPGRLVQEDWAGLVPSPQPEDCCLYLQDKETICHTSSCGHDKGQHLAHGKGQGSF